MWSKENMNRVISELKAKFLEDEWECAPHVLHAVRFDNDNKGYVSIVHVCEYQGEPEYRITHLELEDGEVTEGSMEDWAYGGEEPWYGNQQEYDMDKAEMERRNCVYVQA